jgi:hypothetical protein
MAWYIHVKPKTNTNVTLSARVLSGKRLARNVGAMAAGEPAAPLADNAELTEFISALKQEVRTWPSLSPHIELHFLWRE